MKIGIIDNDLITGKGQRFPNLALMKLSAYHKLIGDNVSLISFDSINPNNLFSEEYDKIFISKVFSSNSTPDFINLIPNLIKGGSGFFYDLSPKLSNDIEHCMPDYQLYNPKIINKYCPVNKQKYFTDFSIGFMTRGCIRRCPYCINKNEKKVYKHSELIEFVDNSRPFIMLLDDNITAYIKFENIFEQLNNFNKPFVFKQGMDFRLLNKRKMDIIFNSNYYAASVKYSKGARTFHFAFDNYKDKEIIERNLSIYYANKQYAFKVFFYVLIGYDRMNRYDKNFYDKDFFELLKRIELLFKYSAYPYIMMHENYKKSPYANYIEQLKKLCNYPALITNKLMIKALEQSNYIGLIDFLQKQYPWFLQLKFNSKLYINKNEGKN
jgi:hypothetical protein